MSLTRAFLEVIDGPGKGRRILLRDGQVRYVGRTTQADDCCPDNPTLSSVHFSVRWYAGKCELKDLNSANGTWRHGKKIVEALLDPGDEFKAGKATFRLLVDEGGESRTSDTRTFDTASGEERPRSDTNLEISPAVAPSPVQPAAEVPLQATGLAVTRAMALPATAQISDEAKAVLVEDVPPLQFVELLASREQFVDALRVVAHSLTKRSAVLWACQCVRAVMGGDLSPQDEAALEAAESWAENPDEERRRKAQAAAEAAEHKTPAAWCAMAAFWSHGSMGPPTAPTVPPAPHLTGHAVAGAVMMAAVVRQPEKAADKYKTFLQLAQQAAGDAAKA